MPKLDWIIEHDTLPPDSEIPPPDLENLSKHRPWWLWPAMGIALLSSAFLMYLWILGGYTDPLPNPDSLSTQLETIIQTEINALNNGDVEIYNRLQDTYWRRLRNQPPLEQWHTGRVETGLAGDIHLQNIEMLQDDAALATINLQWNLIPYQLNWLYRHNGTSWQHTDWLNVDSGNRFEQQIAGTSTTWYGQELITQDFHLQIESDIRHRQQAMELLDQTWFFVNHILEQVPKSGPIPPRPNQPFTITLELDDYFSQSYVGRTGLFHYRIPSPVRVRWLQDGQIDPIIMSSLARHISYDLYARPYINQLDPNNKVAITLAVFWLADHKLGTAILPTTQWLETAAQHDGMSPVMDFVQALQSNLPPQQALNASFSPDTIQAIQQIPDYFGWLLLVLDPHNQIRPMPGPNSEFPLPWYPPLERRLHTEIDPWDPHNWIYGDTVPVITQTHHPARQWLLAATTADSAWGQAYFFHRGPDGWELRRPDHTLMGEQRSTTLGPFEVDYWAWDEAYLAELISPLYTAYDQITNNFALEVQNLSVAIMPPPDNGIFPFIAADLYLNSPSLSHLINTQTLASNPQHTWDIAWNLVGKPFCSRPSEKYYLGYGLFLWQLEQFDLEYGINSYTNLQASLQHLHPPPEVQSERWRSLEHIWTMPLGPQELELLSYALLTVEYLLDQHGRQILPVMYHALESADSMQDWTLEVTGSTLNGFETDWRNWVIRQSSPTNTP